MNKNLMFPKNKPNSSLRRSLHELWVNDSPISHNPPNVDIPGQSLLELKNVKSVNLVNLPTCRKMWRSMSRGPTKSTLRRRVLKFGPVQAFRQNHHLQDFSNFPQKRKKGTVPLGSKPHVVFFPFQPRDFLEDGWNPQWPKNAAPHGSEGRTQRVSLGSSLYHIHLAMLSAGEIEVKE